MSLLDEKLEELKERRSDALNGIVSSQIDINEIATQDNLADDYLFGIDKNPVGIFELLSLYQQERICEKNISYYITDLGLSNIENKVDTDINNALNSSADPPRFTTNYFYYIDSDYNISVNDGTKNLSGTLNSLIYNNGETSGATEMETRANTVVSDLGKTFNEDDVFLSGGYDDLENSDRGSGFLKYWGSHNKVSAQGGGGGEEPTYIIGGNDRIWVWHTTTLGGYQTQGHIASLLTDLKTLIDKLDNLHTILTNIKTARYQMTINPGKTFWEKMSIQDDTIENDQITYINECKNTLNNYYTPLYEERETNDEWIDEDIPNGSLFNKLNNAINGLIGFNWDNLINFMTNRFSTSSSVLGNGTSGLRKWINFWLTEKISLENGTYSSLYFLNQSIIDEKKELEEAENRLNTMFHGDNNVIPTPNILSVYSDPKIDKATGKILQNRIGVIWDGQFHGKKYVLYRKNVKAFDYYGEGSLSFKWENEPWTIIGSQLGDYIYNITEEDPENQLVKTEVLLPTEEDTFYLFRVFEVDDDPIYKTNINCPVYHNATSLQSPIVGEKKEYVSISNGIIRYNNHGFKRGDFILIKSSIKDTSVYKANPINGIYRVTDTDENSIVLDNLINTKFSGSFYKISGAGTIKPLPYVSYDENGKPSLSSRS